MSNYARTLRDSYRAAIARTQTVGTILEGLEPGTPFFGQAVEDLARCMRAEMEAGRTFIAALDTRRSIRAYRWRGHRLNALCAGH